MRQNLRTAVVSLYPAPGTGAGYRPRVPDIGMVVPDEFALFHPYFDFLCRNIIALFEQWWPGAKIAPGQMTGCYFCTPIPFLDLDRVLFLHPYPIFGPWPGAKIAPLSHFWPWPGAKIAPVGKFCTRVRVSNKAMFFHVFFFFFFFFFRRRCKL